MQRKRGRRIYRALALCLALLVLLAEPAAAGGVWGLYISPATSDQLLVTKEIQFSEDCGITEKDLEKYDLKFDFSAYMVSEAEKEQYKIGEKVQGYKIAQGRILGDSFFAGDHYDLTQIPENPSEMPLKEKVHFSTVSFHKGEAENKYFEVDQALEDYLQKRPTVDAHFQLYDTTNNDQAIRLKAIADNDDLWNSVLLKYWGAMRRSTHMESWVIRKPIEGDFSPEEKQTSAANGWPDDTVFYRFDWEPLAHVWQGKPVGREDLQETSSGGNGYSEIANLARQYSNFDGRDAEKTNEYGETVTYHAWATNTSYYYSGVGDWSTMLLDRFPLRKLTKYKDGSIQSIAKPIFTRSELETFLWRVGEDQYYYSDLDIMKQFYPDVIGAEDQEFMDEGKTTPQIIYRFLLREEPNADLEEALGKKINYSDETKILDVSRVGVLVFNSVAEADTYYQTAGKGLGKQAEPLSLGWDSMEGTLIAPATFTNTINKLPTPPSPKPQTKTIEGQKSWKDDKEEDRPKEITVKLLDGEGKDVQKTTTTAEKGWKYVFKDLPVKDAKGQTISYKVEEVVPEGYTASYEAFNITNSKKPTEEASSSEPPVPGGDSSEPLIPGGSTSDSPFPGGDFSSELYPGTSSVTEVSSEEEVSEIRQVVKKKPSKTGWFFPTPPTGDAGKTLPLIVLAAAVVALVLVSKKSRKSN